jgi:hypothetical protein
MCVNKQQETNTKNKKLERFWQFGRVLSIILGSIASVISILIFIGIQDIKTMLRKNPRDLIDLTLNEKPSLYQNSLTVFGSINIKKSPISPLIFLRNTNSDVFAISKLTNSDKWRINSPTSIQHNGIITFDIKLSVGECKDSTNKLQIILVSCPGKYFSDGIEFSNPVNLFESYSNLVTYDLK